MEFFGTPLIDNDLYKMLGRFALNLVVLLLVVRYVYYQRSRSKDFLFSFCMINIVTFFICFILKKLQLEMGMALGLFAIFGVLRYRTDAIPIREMSYLFIVIGVATVNALANRKVSWMELAMADACLVVIPALLESMPMLRQESREEILYDRVDLIAPDKHAELIDDLQQRSGLTLSRIELGRIDLLRDAVTITVFYYPHEQPLASSGSVFISRKVPRQ